MHSRRRELLFVSFLMSFGATIFTLVLCLRNPAPPGILILLTLFAGMAGMGAALAFMIPDHFYRVQERLYRPLQRRLQPWLIPAVLVAMLLAVLIELLGRHLRR